MTQLSVGRRRAIQLGLATGAAITFGGGSPTGAQPAEVKVALLVPLSGAWARQGLLMKVGAEMAIDDVNISGGIKALGGAKMKLMLFDAGDSSDKAKNAAQRMVAQEPDLVGGSGAWLSSFTLAVTEVTERAELPWLTESYSDAITNRGFRYVFQTAMTAEGQSTTSLLEALAVAKSAGVQVSRVGIVSDNTASNVNFFGPIRQAEIARHSLKLLVDETYTPPLSDVTNLVQRVRSARPQLLFLGASNVSDTKLLLDKMNEFGLGHGKVPVLGNGGAMAASEMLNIVGADELEGLMVTVANWGGKGQEALIKRFTERTKEPWFGQDSIQTYFEMLLLREAVERAGSTERHKVAEVLRNIDLTDGPALLIPGRRVKFDDKGRVMNADLVIVQWQNGKPVPVYPLNTATAAAVWPKS